MTPTAEAGPCTRCGLALDPLDVLFLRDGRPFGQGLRGQTRDLPLPQTVAGAIWTSLLEAHRCPFAHLPAALRDHDFQWPATLAALGLPSWIADVRIRGPWFARQGTPADDDDRQLELLFPVPRNVAKSTEDDQVIVRRPVSPTAVPGWQTTPSGRRGLRPLWHRSRSKIDPVHGLLTPSAMADYLADRPIDSSGIVPAHDIFALDHRTGIAVDPDSLTAEDHHIYSASFLSLADDPRRPHSVVLYVEAVFPTESDVTRWPEAIRSIALGGEGRRTTVEPLARPFDFQQLQTESEGDGAVYVLTTPGLFDERLPAAIAEDVVAAACGPAVPVSGWDLARGGPKPSRFAVPAGSVFFTTDRSSPPLESLADRPIDRQQGWGAYLRGIWHDG